MHPFRPLALTTALLCAACSSTPPTPVIPALPLGFCGADGHDQCLTAPYTVALKNRDDRDISRTLAAPLLLLSGGTLTIYPGQTLALEGTLTGDGLKDLHLVSQVTHPGRTLVISLTQVAQVDNNTMKLKIQNPFDKTLKYHLSIVSMDAPDGPAIKITACPVYHGDFDIESWPTPLFKMLLTDLHPVTDADAACAY